MGKRRVMLIRRFDRYWALPGQEHDAADDLLVAQPANGRTEHRLTSCRVRATPQSVSCIWASVRWGAWPRLTTHWRRTRCSRCRVPEPAR